MGVMRGLVAGVVSAERLLFEWVNMGRRMRIF
jgi:hypothetical protein